MPELNTGEGSASSRATSKPQLASADMTMGRDHGWRWIEAGFEVGHAVCAQHGFKDLRCAPFTCRQSICIALGTTTGHTACSATAVEPGRVQRA